MSRPSVAYGVWPEMIFEAGSVRVLADRIGCSTSWLHLVTTGRRWFTGPHARLAVALARQAGVKARAYSHPTLSGAYLISTADGWWEVNAKRDGTSAWNLRERWTRDAGEPMPPLVALEVPFFMAWWAGGYDRQIEKRHSMD